jgi:hypothetical protein
MIVYLWCIDSFYYQHTTFTLPASLRSEYFACDVTVVDNSPKCRPNLLDYDAAVAAFSWDTIRAELQGLPGGKGLNIAHEAVDRHAEGPRHDHVALLWLGSAEGSNSFTYAAPATGSVQ